MAYGGVVISPYARGGHIDHTVLSTNASLSFIEDWWLNGQRLDPRPTAAPTRGQMSAKQPLLSATS